MKTITHAKIMDELHSGVITESAARQRAKAGFVRSARKHLKGKGFVEDAFNTVSVRVPNPLTLTGYVVVALKYDSNPYSDPGSFFTARSGVREIRISKSRLLT